MDAARILGLIDLTSLEAADDEDKISTLAARGLTAFGPVAAICVWPHLVSAARKGLGGAKVHVAAVANFPGGDLAFEQVLAECTQALDAGADEIDLVYPYKRHLDGDAAGAEAFTTSIRAAIPSTITVKIILETGAHPDAAATMSIAQAALRAGADFLKTSTGKIPQGASLDAIRLLLAAATTAQRPIGVKASGGIRRLADARDYLSLADAAFQKPVTARQFRFGASALLDDVLANLAGKSPETHGAGY
jgi:deoxyribose-phosphate aldolase